MSDAIDNEGVRARPRPRCMLCSGAGEILYGPLRDRLFGTPGGWSLRRCGVCGLCWVDPQPEPEALVELYSRYHTHVAVAPPGPAQRILRGAVPRVALGYPARGRGRLERIAGGLFSTVGPIREAGVRAAMGLPGDAPGRLLDVGCGSGALLHTMQALGWQVTGLETDRRAARAARAALPGVTVHESDLTALELPADSFDAVSMSHVVEHLPDPLSQLRSSFRALRPGGRLALATPNTRSLGRIRFGEHWRGWEVPRHAHIFDPHTLSLLVRRAGFRVRSVSTPSAAAWFLWVESATAARGAPPRAARLRALAFWTSAYLRNRAGNPCGEEVLLLAERPR